MEVAAARVCFEAGARVETIVFLRNMNSTVQLTDACSIEVVANGLPLFCGAQLAVDTTLASVLRGDGRPRTDADRVPAIAICDAERAKNAR